VIVGIVLELIVALAIVGTGVALYPILKRQNEEVALPDPYGKNVLPPGIWLRR
jgi:hypothetical protein